MRGKGDLGMDAWSGLAFCLDLVVSFKLGKKKEKKKKSKALLTSVEKVKKKHDVFLSLNQNLKLQ